MRHGEEVAAGPGRGTAAGEDRTEDRAVPVPGRVVEFAATLPTGAGPPRATGAQALDQGDRGGGDGFHPIAEVWPLLPEPELQELADDIGANGLRNPIWRHRDGRIIDGRNRWLACRRAGVDCPSNTYEGQDGAELIADGTLPSLKIGKRRLVRLATVRRLLVELERAAEPAA